MTRAASIGIDLGHSSSKIKVKGLNGIHPPQEAEAIAPTVVRDWFQIANEDTAQKALLDTVTVRGKKFFIGVTAQRQGQAESFTGQNRNWIQTVQHDALLVGAWNRAQRMLKDMNLNAPDKVALVLGLPASYYAEQRGLLRSRAWELLEPLKSSNQTLEIYVESQSRAPILCMAFDQWGKETGRAGDNESWGGVEVGQLTTDFTLLEYGQEIDSLANSVSGMHMVYDKIGAAFKAKGLSSDFETISEAIRNRKIKVYGKEMDVTELVALPVQEFSNYILDEVTNRFGEKAQRMDGIVIAGGGAYIVGQPIADKYPNAVILENPRFAVAEGYARFGLLTLS